MSTSNSVICAGVSSGAADIVAAVINNTNKPTSNSLSMSDTVLVDENSSAKPKKNCVKDLPSPIANASEEDLFRGFTFKSEVNKSKKPGDFSGDNEVAVSLKLTYKVNDDDGNEHEKEHEYILDDLTIDQLRGLCRKIGCTGYSSLSKYSCRLFIAKRKNLRAEIRKSMAEDKLTQLNKQLLTDLRLINACFHGEVRTHFLASNDIKVRKDHETGHTHKSTNILILDMHNNPSDDTELIEIDVEHEMDVMDHLKEEPIYAKVDLKDYIPFACSKAMMQRLKKFFDLRKWIHDAMTQSGTHDSDAWDFLDAAIRAQKGCNYISKYSLFYFYLQCELYPVIDQKFQPFMKEELKGSSNDQSSATSVVGKKKRSANTSNEKLAESVESAGTAIVGLLEHLMNDGKIKQKLLVEENLNKKEQENKELAIKLLTSGQLSPDTCNNIKLMLTKSITDGFNKSVIDGDAMDHDIQPATTKSKKQECL